ncbi:MAG: prolipoprotein diacylglyceryl transferase [Pseudomonadota bacterium]
MQAALTFPEIAPEIVSFTVFGVSLAIRWYALAYIVGILIGWQLIASVIKRPSLWPAGDPVMTREQLEALLTWVIIGVVVGGRLGYVLFYEPDVYLADPIRILWITEGGMAFHGGLLGVVVAGLLFSRQQNLRFLSLADALALATPPGLFLGRIANFINAELWGRPSDAAWAVTFPSFFCRDTELQNCAQEGAWIYFGDEVPRHPSQLYESALEGLVLGLVLVWLAWRGGLKRPGLVAGIFFAGYAAARIFVELFRQADQSFIDANPPWGYVIEIGPWGLTMGQVLSLPMLILGLCLIAFALGRRV